MIDFHLVCYSEKELNSVVSQMQNPRLGLEISDRQSVFGIITNRKCFVGMLFLFLCCLLSCE
jgi:hypothetical protein